MRHAAVTVGLGLLVFGVGCSHFPFAHHTPDTPGIQVNSPTPTAQELISSLNENAHRVQGLECRTLDMDCTQGIQSISLRGGMVCQKPRNFRMNAKIMGNTAVDMGSNDQEFWYWISKADPPYLFHCSYQDFSTGQVRMPFPFQPEWLMEALGVAEYDASKQYEITTTRQGGIELAEKTLSPQGQPVRKVTVLTRKQNQFYVTAHMLEDPNKKLICIARVSDLQQDPNTRAILPHIIQLEWPAERVKMRMVLDHPTVNPQLPPQRVATLFNRPALRDVPSYDLARGLDVAPAQVRRAGGFFSR